MKKNNDDLSKGIYSRTFAQIVATAKGKNILITKPASYMCIAVDNWCGITLKEADNVVDLNVDYEDLQYKYKNFKVRTTFRKMFPLLEIDDVYVIPTVNKQVEVNQ